jgi:hypothetical protein
VSLNAYAAPGRLSRTEQEFAKRCADWAASCARSAPTLGLWIDPGGEVMHLVDDAGRSAARRS